LTDSDCKELELEKCVFERYLVNEDDEELVSSTFGIVIESRGEIEADEILLLEFEIFK
jgi:hypothetical protein